MGKPGNTMDESNLPLFPGTPLNGEPRIPPSGLPLLQPKIRRSFGAQSLQSLRPLEPWFWDSSKGLVEIRNEILLAAPRDIHILTVGESGTGKEIVAREINHIRRQARGFTKSESPFVAVNSGAIPESLAESILFGHERGAFTSARESRSGKFEMAGRGSIFLDEIQNLPLSIQAKLLRVLQTGEIDKLGAAHSYSIQAQVIAASNVSLERLVDLGQFRRDLYFRLNAFPIYLPPLRSRAEDIPKLSRFFLDLHQKQHSTAPLELSANVLNLFLNYPWPGNIRELEHCLLYASLRCLGPQIEIKDLPAKISGRRIPWIEELRDLPSVMGNYR